MLGSIGLAIIWLAGVWLAGVCRGVIGADGTRLGRAAGGGTRRSAARALL